MSSTPTQSSTKTKSSFKKNLTRSVYLCGAALLIASAAVPSAVALAQTDATPRVERTGPGLAGISLLTNSQLVSNLANPLQQNADGNYNLDLTYTGSGVADVGLATKKIIMFALAQELRGKVTGAANIDVSAALTDIDLSKIPGVSAEIAIIEGLLGALNVPGVDLNPLKNAIAQLTGPQPLGTYTANVAGTVTNNYISADITDGLGNYVRQTVSGLFTDVEATLAALPHGNPLLATLIAAVNTLLNILEGAVSSTSTVLDDLLNVNLLGHTSAHLTTAVTNPNVAESHIYGALVNNAAVDINILTQNGDPVDLQFAQTAVNPLENYNVATPSLDQATAGDTAIKGNVVLEEPIPDGTTFKAIATLGDGSTAEGTVNPDGSFTINTKSLTAEEVVQVHIEAANGEYTKDGANASVTVQAENPTNPLENYNVATPTIDQGHAGDTKVTGSVNLETPIPDGTTFKAIATLGDGSTAEANVDVNGANGTFTINTNELTTDEIVSVAIQAVNGSTNKNGLPAEMTVQAGQPTNPLDNYNVASPTVNPATAGDTSVSGHVDLETPIPDGTTFTAVVTLPDGSTKTATVNPDGSFTVDTGTLTADEIIGVKIQATNGENTKDSQTTTITVQTGQPTNPLDNYNVASPTVNPATAGDTSVSGHVDLETPIPDGTTFTAIVTLPDGSTKTATVNPDGSFTVDTGTLTADEIIGVKIQATNGENTKDSQTTTITVQAGQPTNPLDNYNVASPTVNPATAGDTSVSGHVDLETPIPDGTTFTAVVTLPDGSTKTATVNPDGSFTVDTGTLTADEIISVMIVATNDGQTKNSTPVTITVANDNSNGNNGGNTGGGTNGGDDTNGNGSNGGNANVGNSGNNSNNGASSNGGESLTSETNKLQPNNSGTGTGSITNPGTTVAGSRATTDQPTNSGVNANGQSQSSNHAANNTSSKKQTAALPATSQEKPALLTILATSLLISATILGFHIFKKKR